MFSEPITSPSATSKSSPFHGLSTQKTIQVKKRDGSAERVDITKIVQAIDCCCTGSSRPSNHLMNSIE